MDLSTGFLFFPKKKCLPPAYFFAGASRKSGFAKTRLPMNRQPEPRLNMAQMLSLRKTEAMPYIKD